MAIYKDSTYLTRLGNPIFDEEHAPGQIAPRAGIYRCVGCGREIAAVEDGILPVTEHHPHADADGIARWKLIVFADHRPKAPGNTGQA